MGVDKAGDENAVGCVDDHGTGVGHIDGGPHLADRSVLDQHVADGEVADLRIERKHDAALEKDSPRLLQPRELVVGLRARGAWCERRARRQGG